VNGVWLARWLGNFKIVELRKEGGDQRFQSVALGWLERQQSKIADWISPLRLEATARLVLNIVAS
jgi:hypothetical protein